MKRKTPGTKGYLANLITKFKRVPPESQAKAIEALTNLIEGEDDPQAKSFFTRLKNFLLEEVKTEEITDEK
jgi:hypothetical protein